MRWFEFIFFVILVAFILLPTQILIAQCANDPDDPGNCDTVWIEQEDGRIPPNTSVVRHVVVYRDEWLYWWQIPIRYKNPQNDIKLDSVKLGRFPPPICWTDTIIDRSTGTIFLYTAIVRKGSLVCYPLPPGLDTFATLYFTTGQNWDPSIHNPIDTFRFNGIYGLSFIDTLYNDIQPVYNPPGNLDVGDDPKPQSAKPKSFLLSQNYPNPFNARTVISFALPHASHIKIEIFNILGQKVRDLVDEEVSAGYKQVVWDGRDNGGKFVASGVYLYRLKNGEWTETKRMTLLK